MKVAKNKNIQEYNNRIDVITHYNLVNDDFDFITNDMVDVTTLKNLNYFYVTGRMNHGLYRNSLKSNILPKFEELDYFDKEILINERIYPSTYTKDDLVNIIGQEQYEYVERNIGETEQIENILANFNQYSAYVEDLDEYDIRNSNYNNILTLTTSDDCVDAKYRISWSFQMSNNNAKSISYYRIMIDGDVIYESEINFNDKNLYKAIFNFSIRELVAGQHIIEFDVRSGRKSTTRIKNSRIEFWKLFE